MLTIQYTTLKQTFPGEQWRLCRLSPNRVNKQRAEQKDLVYQYYSQFTKAPVLKPKLKTEDQSRQEKIFFNFPMKGMPTVTPSIVALGQNWAKPKRGWSETWVLWGPRSVGQSREVRWEMAHCSFLWQPRITHSSRKHTHPPTNYSKFRRSWICLCEPFMHLLPNSQRTGDPGYMCRNWWLFQHISVRVEGSNEEPVI